MRENHLQDKSIKKAYSRYARYSAAMTARFCRNYAPNAGPMMTLDPKNGKETQADTLTGH